MCNINKETIVIATNFNIDHAFNCIGEQPVFITIKNHQPNFKTNSSYQFINPTKSEIGRISKNTLDYINTNLKDKLQLNQWKNTKAITNWFTAITKKNNTAFIRFNITEYYPSITEYTLDRALEIAAQNVAVSQVDIRIIKHCCKSLVFYDNKETHRKKIKPRKKCNIPDEPKVWIQEKYNWYSLLFYSLKPKHKY